VPILPELPEDPPTPIVRVRDATIRGLTGTGSAALARVTALLLAVVVCLTMAPSPWSQVGIVATLLVLVEVARKRTF
jgi:hypothetical protein